MFPVVNVFCAFLCWSMAKKRGRKPFRWFVLGLLFSFLAAIILYFLKPRSDTGSNTQSTPVAQPQAPRFTSGSPAASPATQSRAPMGSVQRGQVDLNALRVAVRQAGPPATVASSTPEEERERREFLELVATTAPSLDFGAVNTQTRAALERVWTGLGQSLADSGSAGGLSGQGNFYETGASATPVDFYPVSPDGNPESVSVIFETAIKEFQNITPEIRKWVEDRFHDNFGDPFLYVDEASHRGILLCGGVCEPSAVTSESLDGLCNIVRESASVVRQNLPMSFGGIWVS